VIFGNDHYDLNAQRCYPLDDAATAASDAGAKLPDAIVVDLALRWPEVLGAGATVVAVTVTPAVVSVLVAATDTAAIGTAAITAPLAAISLPQPVTPGRAYPLAPMAAGVGGWIVFGPGVADEPYSGRFSGAAQGFLAAAAGRPYPGAAVASLAREAAATPLVGTVALAAEGDLAVAVETVTLPGDVLVPAAVFRLAGRPAATVPVAAQYVGPCGGRPESGTCPGGAIATINGVAPDCAGRLTIRFEGVGVLPFAGGKGGVVLDLPTGLADVCTAAARRGADYASRCGSSSSSSLILSSSSSSLPSSSISLSSRTVDCAANPVAINLELDPGQAARFTTAAGRFGALDRPLDAGGGRAPFMATATGGRNAALVAAFNPCQQELIGDWSTTAEFKVYRTLFSVGADAGIVEPAYGNAGIVLNARLDPTTRQVVYALALVNYRDNALELWRYNGVTFSPVTSVTFDLEHPLKYGDRGRLEVAVRPAHTVAGQTSLTLSASSPTNPDFRGGTLAVAVNWYEPAAGTIGLGTYRSEAEFYTLTFGPG
jgi:hypothetical protein